MPVSLVGGALRPRFAGYVARETFTQSTATVAQAIALGTLVTHVGMGSATGFNLNTYSLAAGTEGQEKYILATATGEAKISLTGTATGQWVLDAADDWLKVVYLTAKWHVLSSAGATLATST
jgi:hypothetical protein